MNFQFLVSLLAVSTLGTVLTKAQDQVTTVTATTDNGDGTVTVDLCTRDPCFEYDEGFPESCSIFGDDTSKIIVQMVSLDSYCGTKWDQFCVAHYHYCYGFQCGTTPADILRINAVTAKMNLTQVVEACSPNAVVRSTPASTPNPTSNPTPNPTADPTSNPTPNPTADPTLNPTPNPTKSPIDVKSNPTPTPAPNPPPAPVPVQVRAPDPTGHPTVEGKGKGKGAKGAKGMKGVKAVGKSGAKGGTKGGTKGAGKSKEGSKSGHKGGKGQNVVHYNTSPVVHYNTSAASTYKKTSLEVSGEPWSNKKAEVETLSENALLGVGAISSDSSRSGFFVASLVTVVGVTMMSLF